MQFWGNLLHVAQSNAETFWSLYGFTLWGKPGKPGLRNIAEAMALTYLLGCHGGPSRAGRGGSAFATRARCVDGGTGWSSPSVALLRHWAADHWSHGSTGFWRQFGSSAQDDKHIGAGARRGAGLRDLAYRVSKLFSQHCVRLVALRKPVLSGPRVRPGGLSFFGSVYGRGRGARGPWALAPLHLRGCAPLGGRAG